MPTSVDEIFKPQFQKIEIFNIQQYILNTGYFIYKNFK